MTSLSISLQKWGGNLKIMNLAMANIKKGKSATVSLFLFILIASLLLNIGMMVITQLNTFFDHKNDQLNDPHVTFVMDQESYQPAYGDFLANYSGVTESEIEDIIYMNNANFKFGNGELSSSAIFYNADDNRDVGSLKLIEKVNTASAQDIFVPYSFKTNGGYGLGDHIIFTYREQGYEYRISGFFETTMMGTNNLGVMKFMLPETSYQKLENELDSQSEALSISAIMEDKKQSSKLNNDFIKEVQQSQLDKPAAYILGLDIELVKKVH